MSEKTINKIPNVPNLRFSKYSEIIKLWRCSDFLKTFSTNSLSWDQLSYIDESEFKNLHYGLIHNGAPTLINCEEYQLPFMQSKIKNYTLCKNGDIIFADASEDTKDICKPVEFINIANNKVVSGLHTIHARDIKELTVIGFKGYLFSSYNFHKQVHRLTQGTKIFSINPGNFKEMYVGIPDVNEQKDIVYLFSKIDKRIESQNKIIEDLDTLKKSISLLIFGDNSEIKLNWKLVKLSNVLKERKTYDIKESKYSHATLSKEGIYAKIDRYNRDFLVKDEEKNYKVTHLNDICYNPANLKFGVICLNTYGDAIFSPIYVTYEVRAGNDPYFISQYITNPTFIGHIRKYEQGTVYERMAVSSEDFLKGEINLPTYQVQLYISKIFKSINDKMNLELQVLEKYKEQKKFLLSNMFI